MSQVFPFCFKPFLDLFCLKVNILSFDNANNFRRVFKTIEIREEYIIIGRRYSKSNEPLLTYILCIVSSSKKGHL